MGVRTVKMGPRSSSVWESNTRMDEIFPGVAVSRNGPARVRRSVTTSTQEKVCGSSSLLTPDSDTCRTPFAPTTARLNDRPSGQRHWSVLSGSGTARHTGRTRCGQMGASPHTSLVGWTTILPSTVCFRTTSYVYTEGAYWLVQN